MCDRRPEGHLHLVGLQGVGPAPAAGQGSASDGEHQADPGAQSDKTITSATEPNFGAPVSRFEALRPAA
ncbi:hypothetical protein [Streptomyces flavofungini]|uniref:Uncharacterized protein n=1 Tax=Streptomyces flavofungini TaxID=68200 RepID=A0ABS0XGK1_9ACTN|nr:hypothetical protein [Streptomyces flavofungini]MBJ3812366.1 hypothetical protein [Streptomyces flavofungini]GHC88199.1 hypothetical protein GCM10010349_75280 [Streptomyces flavofungini]